jgi:hypothetical protein
VPFFLPKGPVGTQCSVLTQCMLRIPDSPRLRHCQHATTSCHDISTAVTAPPCPPPLPCPCLTPAS